MESRDEFFKEVTIRICSSLDINIALRRTFYYLKLHLPLDVLSLVVRDTGIAAYRRVAFIAEGVQDLPEEIIPIP